MRPELRIARRVEDREHDNALGINSIKDGIRKARHVGTPYLAVNAAKHLGNSFDCVERGVNRRKEFLPKPARCS